MLNTNNTFTGRQDAVDQLSDYINKVSDLNTSLLLIGGTAGVGKTSLVEYFLNLKPTKSCLVLRGKYDENKSSIPYQGIIQAIRDYSVTIFNKPEKERLETGTQLTNLLAPNLRILHDIAPVFKNFTGQSTELQALSPVESNNRFKFVINKVFAYLLSQNKKVILFLDDLHWADKESITLLGSILSSESLSSLSVITTYRNEEVGISHPLSSTIRELSKNNVIINRIDLPPLSPEEINSITNELIPANNESSEMISSYLYEQSRGNPLYVKELINNLLAGQYIDLSDKSRSWKLNLDELVELKVSKNIIDLLIAKFNKLPDETQLLLKQAACLGTFFSSKLLAKLNGFAVNRVEESLNAGIEHQVIVYSSEASSEKEYKFSHDRVKESTYKLIKDKSSHHLSIGRMLLQGYEITKTDFTVDEIVFHLNNGYKLIHDKAEIINLCSLNLTASVSAKNSGSYSSVISNLTIARKLLPVDSWSTHHELSHSIYMNLAESYYLTGDFKKAEELSHLCLERSSNHTEKLRIYNLKIIQNTNLGKWNEALNDGFNALSLLDIDLEEGIDTDKITEQLNQLDQQELLNLPINTDPVTNALMALLNSLVSPVYVLRPDLLQTMVMKMISTSLEFGNNKESAYAFDIYGMILGPVLGEYDKANGYAQLSIKLNEKLNDLSLRCKIILTYVTNIKPWVDDIKSGTSLLDEAFNDGLNSGDLINSGYCIVSKSLQLFHAGTHLNTIQNYISNSLPHLEQTKNPAISITYLTRQAILSLQGSTDAPMSLTDNSFNEEDLLDEFNETEFQHGIHWYYVIKMMLSVIHSDYDHALDYVTKSQNAISGATGQFSVAEHNFYHSLILTHLIKNTVEDSSTEREYRNQLTENQKQLENWSNICPSNFLHKHDLIKAEILAINNEHELAEELYKASIEAAKNNGFIQDAAISSYRLSEFYAQNNNSNLSEKITNEANNLLTSWGAKGLKVSSNYSLITNQQ